MQSGLSIQHQREVCKKYIQDVGGVEYGTEFLEVESGSNDERVEMAKVVQIIRKNPNHTLLVAKLDRMARSVYFLECLNRANIPWKVAEMPSLDNFTALLLMACAAKERQLCVERTRNALSVCKRNGVKLGNPRPDINKMVAGQKRSAAMFRQKMLPVIQEIKGAGVQRITEISRILNIRGFKTRTGKQFYPATVLHLLKSSVSS